MIKLKILIISIVLLFLNIHAQKEAAIELIENADTTYGIIDVNNIKLPLDNNGDLGYIYQHFPSGGIYDNITFLYSGGFYLSGYGTGNLWGNGVHSSARIEDYQPGTLNSTPHGLTNKLFVIRRSDIPFGTAWQNWELAVSKGAKFYDGNNDGIYQPIDLNNNGVWDSDEDRPDFQGDISTWCVYNDAVPKDSRKFDIDPQGIEIRQTIFASGETGIEYDNIIFIRYEITNTGQNSDLFDSVYFSVTADPDIGNSGDDLFGCDSTGNSCYIYNQGSDDKYGINPPAFLIKQLQGPPVFIPGETFTDNNNNNVYDDGIDTPLDSAVNKLGKYIGQWYIPGAKNLMPTAYTQNVSSHPTHGDPDTHLELRNYQLGGRGSSGDPLDPCNWSFGNGANLPNCGEINPGFMYSGDPVLNEGWINTVSIDQRMILSTGPFNLEVNKPVEMIYAYIVGRGTDALNSITKAREISQFAQTVYDNNFQDLPTGIDDGENLVLKDFQLYQNYPNPFNPVTTIKFSVPANVKSEMSNVKLIVFDLLGGEVKTLVNEVKSSGTYEVQFDASTLSSGVYFYRLQAGKFTNTKKLMLIK